jgi:hypothetical protein
MNSMKEKKMNISVSPNYKAKDFVKGISIADKINIFSDRVNGWQIGIAKQIIHSQIPNSDFAILKILVSYFEMIAKYYEGYTGTYKSREFFKKGLILTFPELSNEPENLKQDNLLDNFYDFVRNCLYHNGFTNQYVLITNNIPRSFGYEKNNHLFVVCPTILTDDLGIRFNEYINTLRNPKNDSMRLNFEKRYDFENQKIQNFIN